MVLNKMKSIKRNSGFTIVELLIVIVVIGILAAITIVAYSGITARANSTKAQSNAESAQKVAETYNADTGAYPFTAAALNAGSTSTKMPSGAQATPDTGASPATTWVGTGAANGTTDGLTRVAYACTAAATTGPCNGLGGRINWWNFAGSAVGTPVYVGAASSASVFFYPAT